MMQRTLAIIKPDAVSKGAAGAILSKIEQAGFKVLAAKLIQMSFDDAAGFYAVHRQRPFFTSLCTFMTQGPCIPMVLEADNAIQKWRDLMGATDPADEEEDRPDLQGLGARGRHRGEQQSHHQHQRDHPVRNHVHTLAPGQFATVTLMEA